MEARAERPRFRRDVDLARGSMFAVAHLAFSLLIQLEIYTLDIRRLEEGALSALRFVGTLPFLQLEHLSVAVLLGVVAGRCWGYPTLRWLPQLLLLSLNGWLILDQVTYGIFFEHINFSMNDAPLGALPGMLPSLQDSVLIELDGVCALNVVLCGLLSVWVRSSEAIRVRSRWSRRSWRRPIAAFGVASLALSLSYDNHGLKHHAVLALWRGALPAPPAEEPADISEDRLYRLAFGDADEELSVDAALRRALDRLRAKRPEPHVLLVMLESVGSLQLFPEGQIRSDRTPVLAELLQNGIAFTSVYTTFPGTVRALVNLHTGGPTITWGSVYDELAYPYGGPTLVRTLSSRGYRTALFSAGDMNFENLDGFMAGLGFDEITHAGTKSEGWRASRRVHSWGVADDAFGDEAVEWMTRARAEGRRFFVEYITVSTHHPYALLEDDTGEGGDLESRYLESLRDVDRFLGQLLTAMDRQGLLENTLILVTGDHGEAFGHRHPGNLVHKNFLYEENVRSFLIVLAPGVFQEAVVSPRVASLADVLPTLLGALGARTPEVSGQSLWPPDYRPRPVFFHKNAHPELWGLRDGQWKFVSHRVGAKRFELYDLDLDPGEQHNRADSRAEQVQLYDELCAKWFAVANASFVTRLRDYSSPGGRALAAEETGSSGAKRLVVGTRDTAGRFVTPAKLRETDSPVAWTLWVPYPEQRRIRYAWTSPSGETRSTLFDLSADWSRTWVNYPGQSPLAEGRWRITLWDQEEVLISAHFDVSSRTLTAQAW